MLQKVKNDPKIKLNLKVRIKENIENTTSVDPKIVYESYLDPNKSPLGPQKVKNDPKIKSKLDIRIEVNLENESCSTT